MAFSVVQAAPVQARFETESNRGLSFMQTSSDESEATPSNGSKEDAGDDERTATMANALKAVLEDDLIRLVASPSNAKGISLRRQIKMFRFGWR